MNIIKLILEWLFGRKPTQTMPTDSTETAEDTGPTPKQLPDIPPLKRRFLTSKTECEFYHNLVRAVPEQYVVMAKTRIEDVIDVPYKLRGYFKSRHFDFLVVDRKSMYPRLAVELDDSSHKNTNAEYVDSLKTKVCDAAKLALLRYPAARFYDFAPLQKAVTSVLPANLREEQE